MAGGTGLPLWFPALILSHPLLEESTKILYLLAIILPLTNLAIFSTAARASNKNVLAFIYSHSIFWALSPLNVYINYPCAFGPYDIKWNLANLESFTSCFMTMTSLLAHSATVLCICRPPIRLKFRERLGPHTRSQAQKDYLFHLYMVPLGVYAMVDYFSMTHDLWQRLNTWMIHKKGEAIIHAHFPGLLDFREDGFAHVLLGLIAFFGSILPLLVNGYCMLCRIQDAWAGLKSIERFQLKRRHYSISSDSDDSANFSGSTGTAIHDEEYGETGIALPSRVLEHPFVVQRPVVTKTPDVVPRNDAEKEKGST